MFEIGIQTHFSAAHHLVDYPGACVSPHGHNWGIEVFVRGETLDDLGFLVDFKALKASVQEVIEELDHTDLNAHEHFSVENPTSERIARFLYRRISSLIRNERYRVSRVSVHETPGSVASYWEPLVDD